MDMQKDYENLKKSLMELFDFADQLLGGTNIFNHINWMLVVNTGTLLWFFGILDKFTINNQLVFKWWIILTIICLLIPLITLYQFRTSLFKLNLQLKTANVDCLKAESPDKLNIDKLYDSLKGLLLSAKITCVAEFFFLLGIVSMVSYIITYFIRYK